MTYLKQTRKNKISKKKIGFFVTLLVILMLGYSGLVFPNKFFQSVSYPVLKVRNVAMLPFSGFFEFFKSKETLIDEKKVLQEKLMNLNSRILESQIIEAENVELRSILNREDREENSIIASVLIKPPQSLYDTLVIDVGEGQVELGNKVYTADVEIGTIEDISNKISVVKLHSSPGTKLQVLINGSIDAEALGEGGGRFVISLPKDVEVTEGDVVSIPGRNKLFGVIQKIESEDANSFQTIYFNLPVNISSIHLVEIKR